MWRTVAKRRGPLPDTAGDDARKWAANGHMASSSRCSSTNCSSGQTERSGARDPGRTGAAQDRRQLSSPRRPRLQERGNRYWRKRRPLPRCLSRAGVKGAVTTNAPPPLWVPRQPPGPLGPLRGRPAGPQERRRGGPSVPTGGGRAHAQGYEAAGTRGASWRDVTPVARRPGPLAGHAYARRRAR